jgi:hypothetical protein
VVPLFLPSFITVFVTQRYVLQGHGLFTVFTVLLRTCTMPGTQWGFGKCLLVIWMSGSKRRAHRGRRDPGRV